MGKITFVLSNKRIFVKNIVRLIMGTAQTEAFTVEEMARRYGDFTIQHPLSREAFETLSKKLPDLRMERSSKGITTIMSPVKKGSGRRESLLHGLLFIWNYAHRAGDLYGPNGTFELPDGSIKMPDVSWIAADRSAADAGDDESFIKMVPDFVAEIRSGTDRIAPLQKKMQSWMSYGVRLGWLIDPYTQKVHIYRPDKPVEIIEGFSGQQLSGESVLTGFFLDLEQMKRQ